VTGNLAKNSIFAGLRFSWTVLLLNNTFCFERVDSVHTNDFAATSPDVL
jgi:hypothetical protein